MNQIISIALLIITTLFSCNKKDPPLLTIATAANLQFAMEEITKAFTEETGIACQTIISSSGKLTAQISQGAPYDIFLSADMKYPTDLYEKQLTLEKPKIYANGRLVLWTSKKNIELHSFSSSLSLLVSDSIRHLALANPLTAPYGRAAMEVLEHYDLAQKLKDKFVYGESIAQTNQFITTQAAELGFTSKSVVLSSRLKNQGTWVDIDPSIYEPISQGVVILKSADKELSQAKLFYNFLFSSKAKKILNTFGYGDT